VLTWRLGIRLPDIQLSRLRVIGLRVGIPVVGIPVIGTPNLVSRAPPAFPLSLLEGALRQGRGQGAESLIAPQIRRGTTGGA
jgi:hypothetical protein